ncbi:universal stress protein [Promicromonospora iranensis]|jgi:nucleotide-binding universal stress UspA family protein|uniref:universal stress protein n=1 Tax=Promicromonospora iranensis TaxID=1105144 RepID=UPI0023A9FBA7|nr:universal stress protein [Promicromonospora iranensis]
MSIVVGYVPTPAGEAAVQAAITEARLRDEDLFVVNSAREGAVVETTVATTEDLSRILTQADDAGVRAEVVRGTHREDFTDEILDLAEKHDASLIVIGLRRRSTVGKFIMGSVAQRILLQADHPVLAVKPAR